MLLQSAFVLASSLSFANALPNLLEVRATCNADNCYRAVVASSHAPGPNVAKVDCSSFLLATETLCASTIYVTATATTTAAPATTTITISQTSTDTVVDLTSIATTVTTKHDTLTTIESTTTTEVDLEISTATLTTTIFASAQGLSKRNQKPGSRPQLGVEPDVERRALATSTCPSFRTPSAVPAYASACSGTSRYASACSCNGVTRSTTTMQSTTISTISVTSTVIPTITVTTMKTVDLSFTITSSSFIPATLETTDMTTTVVVSATTTQTSSSSTTVIVSTTASCSGFIVQATSGAYAGQYLRFQDEHTALNFVSAVTSASTFVSLPNGHVAPATDPPALFNTFNDPGDLVYASADYVAGGYPLLTCTFGDGGNSVSGAFSCSSSNGNTELLTCTAEAAAAGAPAGSLIVSNGATIGSDCQVAGLLAISACT